MHAPIFVNLPVADIARSRAFFAELGYAFNEQFSGDQAVVVVLADNVFAMLVQRDLFDSFHPAKTADAAEVKECVVCLGLPSRAAVDALVDRAIAAGGTPGDTEDDEFMYGRSFNDLDGHSWQIFWHQSDEADSGVTP
ncbi:VOC family protein [Mycolicibacterium sp.]|uniref:VOC family protein n=1 Tax=Mycolicibacterium sp. TaxID=2320850 RepID=UPI003D0E4D89